MTKRTVIRRPSIDTDRSEITHAIKKLFIIEFWVDFGLKLLNLTNFDLKMTLQSFEMNLEYKCGFWVIESLIQPYLM